MRSSDWWLGHSFSLLIMFMLMLSGYKVWGSIMVIVAFICMFAAVIKDEIEREKGEKKALASKQEKQCD